MSQNNLRYRVYIDKAQEYRWRLLAGNNEPIADSGEGYKDKADCLKGIALVKGSYDAPVEEGPNPQVSALISNLLKARLNES